MLSYRKLHHQQKQDSPSRLGLIFTVGAMVGVALSLTAVVGAQAPPGPTPAEEEFRRSLAEVAAHSRARVRREELERIAAFDLTWGVE